MISVITGNKCFKRTPPSHDPHYKPSWVSTQGKPLINDQRTLSDGYPQQSEGPVRLAEELVDTV